MPCCLIILIQYSLIYYNIYIWFMTLKQFRFFGPSYLAFFVYINADMNAWPKIASVQSYLWATY